MKPKQDVRVCHVATLTGWGGVERMLVDLLTTAPLTQQHMLLTTSSRPAQLAPVQAAGVAHFEPRRRWRYDPGALLQMARWLRAQRVQVVHTYNAYANAWGGIAARLARVPVVVAGEHGTALNAPGAMTWLDGWAQRSATAVVANSSATVQIVQLRYGVDPARIRLVPNGVPPLPPLADPAALRLELGLPAGALLVGSIGRLDMPKHFHTLVEAAAIVLRQRPDAHFVLVGGGPLRAELAQLAAERGIADRFLLTGWRADARAVVQLFDIVVSTSLQESFGNTLVEAALAGKPVVAPAVGGIPDVVVPGETGLLLRPACAPIAPRAPGVLQPYAQVFRDGALRPPQAVCPADLAAALLALLADPARRAEMGAAAARRAAEAFSLARYAADLEGVYRELIVSR